MEHDDRGSDDLRTRLHAMESKLSRIRAQRDSHNDSARSAADQRNSAHEKRKEVHETISAKMDEQKKVRAQAKLHQASRDEIQQSIREVIARKKGTRDRGPGKSVVIQLSETVGEIERIEDRIMTDGALTLEKENSMIKKLRSLISKRDELIPHVEQQRIISIDMNDMDESIHRLRAEADNEHKLMLEQNSLADEIWNEIKPMFEERDFLRGEGDRLHALFVQERGKADETHASLVEMLSKVNEIRDELRSQYEQREKMVRDHNKSVRQALRGPDQNEELADSLADLLLEGSSVTFGGLVSKEGESQKVEEKSASKRKSRRLGTSRGGKR
ncbi:MAG: hypothetical protein QF843_00605 [Candidatus Thalassarchaeaceae archaeon]|nr:hypothetical protein [Candidatus Thalassarchaeaceae archaeon]